MTTDTLNRPAINFLREFSIPLIAGVTAAMLWANISAESYHRVIHDPFYQSLTLHFLTNDLFMTLFFGIAAVEITSNVLPGGSLNPIKRAINPLLATLGGVAGPVGVFFLLNHFMGSPQLMRGWGIPTATDIAMAWLVARMVFGARHPCVSFLLLLAVADDAISLAIIAIFYPDPSQAVRPAWLLMVLAGVGIAFFFNRMRVRNYWPYLLLGGVFSWTGLHLANLHPALALVFIVPFMPHRKVNAHHTVFDAPADHRSTLLRFEHDWKLIVDFGLFMFGLCNAGVKFSSVGPITGIVLLSLIVGKMAGVTVFACVGKWCGFPLPAGMGFKELVLTGLIAGIGLTVALFVAGEAFSDPTLQDAAKMGALGSALIGPVAEMLGRVLRIQRIKAERVAYARTSG